MRKQEHYLETLLCLLVVIFFVARVGFMAYNHALAPFSLSDVFDACRIGLVAHDFGVALMLLSVPWLLTLVATRFPRLPLRWVLVPWYLVVLPLTAVILVADTVMYEFWQFKLNAVVLSYAAHPEGATGSVPLWFIAVRVLTGVGLAVGLVWAALWLTPRHIQPGASVRYIRQSSIIWGGLIALVAGFMHIGDAYRQDKSLFLNHCAVNPVLAFTTSFYLDRPYGTRYNYMNDAQADSLVAQLYPQPMDDIQDTLLRVQRPNVLVVLLESFGGTFVEELGGLPHVAPNLSQLIPQGIFWEQYYSNSFRTDRGIASIMAGNVAYPEVSLMTRTEMHGQLPSLSRTLGVNGYETAYLYGGPMTNMGKRQYLESCQVQQLMDDTAFTPQELTSTWGADDSISARLVYTTLARRKATDKPLFMVYQTLSSHEPWVVPSRRLEEDVPNAFAYTDACVGQLISSLKDLSIWRNLLVVVVPDHGHLYHQDYSDPLFFHSPMLWLGGAIGKPRRMTQLMNQSDLAATLLSQMRLPHAEFPWSRNVLSRHYTRPFAYCNYPGGVFWADATGTTIFDLGADVPIVEGGPGAEQRIHQAKAVLQRSHDHLDSVVAK